MGQLADMYVQEIEDVRQDLHEPPFRLDEGSEQMRQFLVRMCLQALHPSPCESVQLQLHLLCWQLDSCMLSINEQVTRADYDDGRDAKERWNSWIAEALLGGGDVGCIGGLVCQMVVLCTSSVQRRPTQNDLIRWFRWRLKSFVNSGRQRLGHRDL